MIELLLSKGAQMDSGLLCEVLSQDGRDAFTPEVLELLWSYGQKDRLWSLPSASDSPREAPVKVDLTFEYEASDEGDERDTLGGSDDGSVDDPSVSENASVGYDSEETPPLIAAFFDNADVRAYAASKSASEDSEDFDSSSTADTQSYDSDDLSALNGLRRRITRVDSGIII